MTRIHNENYNHLEPKEIADGVYWIGFLRDSKLFCNPI